MLQTRCNKINRSSAVQKKGNVGKSRGLFQNLVIGFEIRFINFFKEKTRDNIKFLPQRSINEIDRNSGVQKKKNCWKVMWLFSNFSD